MKGLVEYSAIEVLQWIRLRIPLSGLSLIGLVATSILRIYLLMILFDLGMLAIGKVGMPIQQDLPVGR